ncbi:Homeobox-leucine zipper protein ATHB-14, partial [Striga hermonthica]
MSLVLASVGQFWKRGMGLVLDRWRRNPPYFLSDIYTLMLVASSNLKHIPISDKLRLVFYPEKIAAKIGILVKYHKPELRNHREAAATLDADIPEATEKVVTGRCEHDVVARKKENQEDYFDNKKLWDLKYDTEHLEGLNWDLTVVESGEPKVYYTDNGRIVIHTATLYGPRDDELAALLAHEVIGFWFGAILVRLCGFALYSCRRMELEAYYISLMLMASAGYDPRLVPPFIRELESIGDKYYMDTTHPTPGRVAEMLSQDTYPFVESEAVDVEGIVMAVTEGSRRGKGVRIGGGNVGKYVRYTEKQIEALDRVYAECPNPNRFQLAEIICEEPALRGLDNKQLKIWFQNRRSREKQKKESDDIMLENRRLTAANNLLRQQNDDLQEQLPSHITTFDLDHLLEEHHPEMGSKAADNNS